MLVLLVEAEGQHPDKVHGAGVRADVLLLDHEALDEEAVGRGPCAALAGDDDGLGRGPFLNDVLVEDADDLNTGVGGKADRLGGKDRDPLNDLSDDLHAVDPGLRAANAFPRLGGEVP